MKVSLFGLVSLAAILCSLQSATAANPFPFPLPDICKWLQNRPPFCPTTPAPDTGNGGNSTTGSGTGNGTAAGNATEGSAGATRSLPIIGSRLPLEKLIPIR